MRKSKHTSFGRLLYSSVDEAATFHFTVCSMFEHLQSNSCQPTAFHMALDTVVWHVMAGFYTTSRRISIASSNGYLRLMRRQYVFTAKSTSPDVGNAIGPMSSSRNCSEAVMYQTARTA